MARTRDGWSRHGRGNIRLFERTFVHDHRAPFASSRKRFALSQRDRYAAHVVADYREVYVKGKGSSIMDNDRLSAPASYRPLSPCRQIDSRKWRIAVIAISNAIYVSRKERLGGRGRVLIAGQEIYSVHRYPVCSVDRTEWRREDDFRDARASSFTFPKMSSRKRRRNREACSLNPHRGWKQKYKVTFSERRRRAGKVHRGEQRLNEGRKNIGYDGI